MVLIEIINLCTLNGKNRPMAQTFDTLGFGEKVIGIYTKKEQRKEFL